MLTHNFLLSFALSFTPNDFPSTHAPTTFLFRLSSVELVVFSFDRTFFAVVGVVVVVAKTALKSTNEHMEHTVGNNELGVCWFFPLNCYRNGAALHTTPPLVDIPGEAGAKTENTRTLHSHSMETPNCGSLTTHHTVTAHQTYPLTQ